MNSVSNKTVSFSGNDELTLGQLFASLVDGRWWIVGFTAVFAIFGLLTAVLSTPIYRADALLQVEEKSGAASMLTGELGELFSGESSANTEIEVLKSRMVIGRTVDALGLTNIVEPKFFPIVGKGLNRVFGESKSVDIQTFAVDESLVGESLRLVVGSNGSYEVFDPEGEFVLAGVVGELATGSGITLSILEINAVEGDEFVLKKEHRLEVVTQLQNDLSVVERGRQSGILTLALEGDNPRLVQRTLNSIASNYESQNVAREAAQAEKSLEFLQRQLPDIRDRLRAAEDDLNEYRQERESVDLSREAEALLQAILELEGRINDLNMEESDIAQRFTPQHPAYRTLIENRSMLEKQREDLDARVRELPETQRDVLRRSRELEVNQEVYTTLLNRVQELTVVKAGTVGYVRILDRAETAVRPVKPKKLLITILMTLLGSIVGVIVVLVKTFSNSGIRDTQGVEELGLPVFGSVPLSPDQTKINAKDRGSRYMPLAIKNPADLAVEALRSLRTSIHFAMMDAPNKVVMVSGAAPGAGKSFLSLNLALTLAGNNQKVLLIDADMRRGHMHTELNIAREVGLASYLQGLHSLDDIINQDCVGGIDFVATGEIPPNPAELLMHERFRELLEWADEHYDLVIVDTPPVLAVTDAAIIGKLAGVRLLVGRYAQITIKEIQVAVDRFEKAGITMNAFILNGVERNSRVGYNYQYDYGSA